MSATHYEVLGVLPSASAEEIRLAYRKCIRAAHPDRAAHSSGAASTERAQAINAAYDVLSDARARRDYDAKLRDDVPSRKRRREDDDDGAPPPKRSAPRPPSPPRQRAEGANVRFAGARRAAAAARSTQTPSYNDFFAANPIFGASPFGVRPHPRGRRR